MTGPVYVLGLILLPPMFILLPGLSVLGGFVALLGTIKRKHSDQPGRLFIAYPILWTVPVSGAILAGIYFAYLFYPLALVLGALYWLVAEHRDGQMPIRRVLRKSKLRLALLAPAAGALVYVAALPVWSLARIGMVSAFPPDLGNPPYATQYPRQMTPSVLLAVQRFPDAQSCLEGGSDPARHEDLVRLDWDRMKVHADAEVCLYRLLALWGGAAESRFFLEAQGFTMIETESAEAQRVAQDGTLRVSARWKVADLGPKFPTSFGIARFLAAMPYTMSITTGWDASGRELLFVDVSAAIE